MSNAKTYLTSRIKEALYNAEGNKSKAMQQIMSWSQQDQQLLQALTKAHLSGIVAYHVDKIASGGEIDDSAQKPSPMQKPKPRTRNGRKRVDPAQGSPFGKALLQAASSTKSSVFGLESYEAPAKADDNATQRQADAMKHLASFSHTPQTKRIR